MTDTVQLARQLWSEVDAAVSPYPPGVVAVPEPVRRTAFFPGGLGLWLEGGMPARSAVHRVLIVGQDFNTLATYNRIQMLRSEVGSSATWRNLLPVLSAARLPVEACVFTNFYMGLRQSGRETGTFPGAKDRSFKDRCGSFFIRQLRTWQSELIITLGVRALQAVADLCGLRVPQVIRDCDFIFRNILMPQGAAALVALTHPSYYPANVGQRRYREVTGANAEQAMLADALAATEMRF